MLPFTHDEFTAVFARYNAAIWPTQSVAYILGVGMLVAVARGRHRAVAAGLAAMWLWTGVAYHGAFFTAINPAAWVFGGLFVLQGLLLLRSAAQDRLRFGLGSGEAAPMVVDTRTTRLLGWSLIVYAMLGYPAAGLLLGQRYPNMPTFGVTPCPVALFTWGLLLLSTAPVPRALLVVPVVWSLIGGSAAVLLHVPQDWVLLLAALAVVPVVMRDRKALRSLQSRRSSA